MSTPDPAQSVDARAVLAEALYADPSTRPLLLDAVRKRFPQAHIPELDARDVIRREMEPIRKELTETREALQQERNQRWLDSQRAAIVSAVGEENIPAVEKLMKDEAIGTHAAAAELWAARQRVAAPTAGSSLGGLSVPGLHGAGGDEYKDILTNDKWSEQRAAEMIDDYRKGRGSKWSQYA